MDTPQCLKCNIQGVLIKNGHMFMIHILILREYLGNKANLSIDSPRGPLSILNCVPEVAARYTAAKAPGKKKYFCV